MTQLIKRPPLNLAEVRSSRLGDRAPHQAPHWMGSLLKTVSPSPALATSPHKKNLIRKNPMMNVSAPIPTSTFAWLIIGQALIVKTSCVMRLPATSQKCKARK